MAYFRCGGGGVPASVKTDMNAVLNKKFGTSTDYPPADWAPTVNLMGPLPEKTQASASVCSFDDGADDVPTKSLVVTIPPTLSGVSSLNEKQTGRNLIDQTKYNQDNSSRLTIGQTRSNANRDIHLKKGTYTITVTCPEKTPTIYYTTGDGNISLGNTTASRSFTLSEDSDCSFWLYLSGILPSDFSTIQLEFGSTAHAYEPYQTPTQYTSSLGRTIYGGTADVVNGEGRDDRLKYELDETDSWGAYSGTTHSFWHNVATGENRPIKQTEVTTSICNELAYSSNTPATAPDFSFCIQGGQRIVVTADSTIDTVDKFKTWLSSHNLVFVCPATTPTDFTFTGQEINTRLGYNAFWSDSGDTEVTYRADIDLLLGGN